MWEIEPGDLAPGSPQAVEFGCTCPTDDNHRGGGYGLDGDGTVLFVVAEDCPLHGGNMQLRPLIDVGGE